MAVICQPLSENVGPAERVPRTRAHHVSGDLLMRSRLEAHLPGPPKPSEHRVLSEGHVTGELRTRSEGLSRTSPAAGSPPGRCHFLTKSCNQLAFLAGLARVCRAGVMPAAEGLHQDRTAPPRPPSIPAPCIRAGEPSPAGSYPATEACRARASRRLCLLLSGTM